MKDDRTPAPDARTEIIKRGPGASLPDLPRAADHDVEATLLLDARGASLARGSTGAPKTPSTRGTMFGQLYSPHAITQEVIKKPGPPPK